MDSRLANLLEAKQSILARWKGQRLNRRLRKKIAILNKEIEEYCRVLCRQQWDEVCNSLDGRIRKGSGWGLLKHLLDESGSKSKPAQRSLLCKIIDKARKEMADDKLLDDLARQYLPLKSTQSFTPFRSDTRGLQITPLTEISRRVKFALRFRNLTVNLPEGPMGSPTELCATSKIIL